MEELIINLLYDLIYVLAALVAAFFVAYLKKKLGTEKMKQIESELAAKQELALLAVRFVEQAYKDLHGQAKYNHAAAWLSGRAGELGLKVSDSEIKGLIEAALRSLKDEFGEEWAKATSWMYFQHRVRASSEAEARAKAAELTERKLGRKVEKIGYCRQVVMPGWWEFWAKLKPFDRPL